MTERITCYTARYAPEDRVSDGGGKPEEGEDIAVVEMPLDEALAQVQAGGIIDAKSIMLLQHLKLTLNSAT